MLLSPARLTSAVGASIAVAKWEATARKRIWETKLRFISEQGWNGVYSSKMHRRCNTKTNETVDFETTHARVFARPSLRKSNAGAGKYILYEIPHKSCRITCSISEKRER